MGNFIEIINGSKKFGDTTVLEDINLCFEKGKIHGVVGRNGSGKTIMLKCLAGLTPLTGGKVIVSGIKLNHELMYPVRIGIIIENPGFLNSYSGYKNLKMLAGIANTIKDDDVWNAMKVVGLDPNSKKHVSKYSLGMKQKLGVAQALMEKPELLILDEPMNGLDSLAVKNIHSILRALADEGVTILIATHIKDDLEKLCDTITYMDDGKVLTTTIG